jgi:hypothetical protein
MRAACRALATALATLVLTGCSGNGGGSGGDSASATVTVQGDVPLAYVKRSVSVRMNPTNGAPFAPGGDLMLREKSSPSAPEYNLTATVTQGLGDASDPEVSYDGRQIVFALRCPSTNTSTVGGAPACTGRWNLWRYTLGPAGALQQGTLERLTDSSDADDVDPVFLPAGRGFVFTSNRQGRSRTLQALGRNYLALDEYERERVFNLHTMAADGSAITQISVNQSHDRNPVIRPNGDILFSRWEHVAGRNRFTIFRARPDGTDLFVLYGAHSAGNSFLHPRDMDPAGAYKGQLVSSLMSLSGTQEGGALMRIDAFNYSEQNTPANSTVPAEGGQRAVTQQELAMDRGLSPFGLATTPYPLWDGSDRILVAWRPCEVTRDGVLIPCANLTEAERTRLASDRTRTEAAADAVQDNAPSAYGIYMFDPKLQTWLNVAAPPPGFMLTDPVALVARPEPAVVEADQRRPRAGAARAGAVRGAQRVRHRQPGPHGRRGAGRGRPGAGLHRGHRQDAAGRGLRPARAGGRPAAPEGPGRPGLPLRPGALPARDARGGTAGQQHGPAPRDRRDRLRAATDPGLCADRARRVGQVRGAGRHAAGAGRGRHPGPGLPDAHQLAAAASGRAPHLRRLPQPAARGVAELGRRRQPGARGLAPGAGRRTPGRRDHGRHPHAAGRGAADAGRRPGVHRRLGRHHASRRAGA